MMKLSTIHEIIVKIIVIWSVKHANEAKKGFPNPYRVKLHAKSRNVLQTAG